jgi:hypothetical protein
MKAITVLCGLLAITVSSFNDLIQERIEEGFSRIEWNEEESNNEGERQIIYLPDYLASITTFQIDVDLTQNILFDISFFSEIKIWSEKTIQYRSISFFKVLFQNIIAPNAP